MGKRKDSGAIRAAQMLLDQKHLASLRSDIATMRALLLNRSKAGNCYCSILLLALIASKRLVWQKQICALLMLARPVSLPR